MAQNSIPYKKLPNLSSLTLTRPHLQKLGLLISQLREHICPLPINLREMIVKVDSHLLLPQRPRGTTDAGHFFTFYNIWSEIDECLSSHTTLESFGIYFTSYSHACNQLTSSFFNDPCVLPGRFACPLSPYDRHSAFIHLIRLFSLLLRHTSRRHRLLLVHESD